MEHDDEYELKSIYNQRIDVFGHGNAAIGEPLERQHVIFETLFKALSIQSSSSILDLGCGYAALFSFLKTKGWSGRYTGIEINESIATEAMRRLPSVDIRCLNIENTEMVDHYDICTAIGVLGHRTKKQAPMEYFESIVQNLWNVAHHAVCFNVLSPLADFAHINHIRPSFEEVLNIITKFTPRFSLYHDYMRYEYLIVMHKSYELQSNKVFFQ